ncbi:MAG: protein kinase [Gammaproteobacteria bacterium]|nr:protein kinase [Gammaproteobacteria bacterium]
MNKQRKEHRDRLITLAFVSILLVLIYGPAAPWFVSADRLVYDQVASRLQNTALADGLIVSIDPAAKSPAALMSEYGQLIRIFKEQGARRIVITQPPALGPDAALPVWAAGLSDVIPVFVPSNQPFSAVATKSGFINSNTESDGIMRRSPLWQLNGGVMSPSLALAITLADPKRVVDPRMSMTDDSVYLSNYAPIPRLSAADILNGKATAAQFSNKTIFLDASLPLVSAAAVLPSGQYVTTSEITATLLANMEQRQSIISPTWVRALEWLVPALLAIVAALFMPGRKRADILFLTLAMVASLILIEALMLMIFRIRIDLGRPLLIFLGAGILTWWLQGTAKQTAVNAYKRGSDFLAAGRLEPAFAEFRRCKPTETISSVMYKLSLAFEKQEKPERAEAVLDWLKRTHGATISEAGTFGLSKDTPKRLGRYEIERKLGRGAMGAVYLAKDPRINRPVALKVIPIEKEFEDEELKEARQRFYREAESAGRLTHPNIVTVYDAGEDKHLAYIAMEFLQGSPLTPYTDKNKLLAPSKALELCARTADALDYAHNQGVVHRDIKPANILYNMRDDVLKISDFGVARMTDNNRTKTGIVLGTPMYMSPEQLNAEPVTGHSDLFSLGVTLYELLAGEVPFKATNIAVLMTKITTEDPTPVSNRRAGVPPSVDSVLFKALAKRPEDRFANGGEMAIALRNCARFASK